jgi:hypothetical protein
MVEHTAERKELFGICSGICLTTILAGLSIIGNWFSERIKSQEDLNRITEEETRKLGIKRSIRANFHESDRMDAIQYSDGTCEINIGGCTSTRSSVRHELYHIYRGHLDGSKFMDKDYFLRREPQAIIYEVFRIKI